MKEEDYILNIPNAQRRFHGSLPELRAAEGEDDNSRVIEGLGIVYNSLSENFAPHMRGGFYELIEPGAANGLLDDENIMILDNHMSERVLGRNRNTATLTDTPEGVLYRLNAPNTTVGNDMMENVRLKNIRKSSFAFVMKEEGVRMERGIKWEGLGEINLRRVIKFDRLLDFSPVTYPAYDNSSVAKRYLKHIFEEEERESKKYLVNLMARQRALEIED